MGRRERAAFCFTDPPWNVRIGQDSNPRHRQREGLQNDNLSSEEFALFLLAFLQGVETWLDGDLYCVLGAGEWPTLDGALRCAGFHWSATIIWVKQSFVLGMAKYHRRYEPIWYGWREKGSSSYVGGRDQDDVWLFDRPTRSPEHPTMKPVALVEKAIENSSKPGDIVLDPFCGSGTTLIACEASGRKCRAIEIEPKYGDVILARWERATGKKAHRLTSVAEARRTDLTSVATVTSDALRASQPRDTEARRTDLKEGRQEADAPSEPSEAVALAASDEAELRSGA
jgi:DNA modification methylase